VSHRKIGITVGRARRCRYNYIGWATCPNHAPMSGKPLGLTRLIGPFDATSAAETWSVVRGMQVFDSLCRRWIVLVLGYHVLRADLEFAVDPVRVSLRTSATALPGRRLARL